MIEAFDRLAVARDRALREIVIALKIPQLCDFLARLLSGRGEA